MYQNRKRLSDDDKIGTLLGLYCRVTKILLTLSLWRKKIQFLCRDVGTGTSIDATACADFIFIPNLSPNGINEIAVPVGTLAFQSEQCGSNFGIQGMGTIASALTCKYCFCLD